MSAHIRLVAEAKKTTVAERLSELGRKLEALQTGEIKRDIVEYRREGYRFSVRIRPQDKGHPADWIKPMEPAGFEQRPLMRGPVLHLLGYSLTPKPGSELNFATRRRGEATPTSAGTRRRPNPLRNSSA